ncbi:polysaccharide pyruvyl transferase family protein [Halobacillus sp. MO56]
MSKKIASLVFAYGLKNGGDMAITLGAIQQLLNAGYEVNAYSLFDKKNKEYEKSKKYLEQLFPEIKVHESPFSLNREGGKFNKLKAYVLGLLTIIGVQKKRDFYNKIKESDVLYFNGGNLFRSESFTDYTRLLALMYPLKIARKLNLPYFILPQSASTIDSIGRLILKKNLQKAQIVWTREKTSYNYLKKCIPDINIKSTVDLAFFIENTPFSNVNNLVSNCSNKRKVAFTIRTQTVGDLKQIDKEKYDQIVSLIKRSIVTLLKTGSYEVILIIQTKKDKEVTTSLYEKISNEFNYIHLIEEYDALKLINIYKHCDVLLGMRLHSIILALLSGTPAVGYFDETWGFKNPGLMNKFNMPYYLISNDTTDLVAKVQELASNKEIITKQIEKIIDEEKNMFTTYL